MDEKDKTLGTEKPSLKDRILEAQAQAMEAQAVTNIFGIHPNQMLASQPPKEDPIQAQVVSSALNAMKDMSHELKESAEKKEELLKDARKSEDTIRQTLYSQQIGEITAVRQELSQMMREVQKQNTPQSAIAAMREIKSFMEEMAPRQAAPPEPQAPRGADPQTTITLEQMKHSHDVEMKKLDLQIAQVQQTFNLELMKFQEESKRRWHEYDDSRQTRSSAMGGLQDLATAIAQSMDIDRQPARVGKQADQPAGLAPAPAPAAGEEEMVQAQMISFKCQGCGAQVTIPDPPGESVSCPNPGCAAVYALKAVA